MFSVRAWLALALVLWGGSAANQDLTGLTPPDRNETAMTTQPKPMRFEHRTFNTEPEARDYADELTQNIGTQNRFFRPWLLTRGRDKGRWTVARYDMRSAAL